MVVRDMRRCALSVHTLLDLALYKGMCVDCGSALPVSSLSEQGAENVHLVCSYNERWPTKIGQILGIPEIPILWGRIGELPL